MTFIAITTLVTNLSATKFGPQDNHTVKSTNGKFELHVDTKSTTQRITGAFVSGLQGWSFQHEAEHNSFFVSDDGEATAVVQWSWVQDYCLNKAAVVIYGRSGAERTYSYNELSKPRERKPEEVGPIGDFWRVWRGDATINGNLLTINVEGGKTRVIDLKNPQALPPLEAGNETEKAPQTREEMEKMLREREIKESGAQKGVNPKIDQEFLAIKARETAEIESSFPALKPLLGSITEQSQLKVLGGLPNQIMDDKQFEKTLKAKGTVERHGETFFKNPFKLEAADTESLKTLIRDPRSFSRTTDPLLPAGFGAAYSLVYETNGSVTEIQICSRNHKIRAIHKEVDIYSYLTPEAFKKINELLGKYEAP